MLDAVLENVKEYLREIISDRKRLLKILMIVLVLLIAVAFRVHKNQVSDITLSSSDIEESTIEEESSSTSIFVDISGAVKNPGVYELEDGTRLYEVIDQAGGLTSEANIDSINRAEFVEDGQKIYIPSNTSESIDESGAIQATGNATSNSKININTASKEQLMEISGVGEVIADRIIEYRTANRFKSIEDIMSVKGIGTSTYEKMKTQITV